MLEVTVTNIATKDYIVQKFPILPRIGDRLQLNPVDKNPEFDTTSYYRVVDVLIFAGDPTETGNVEAELFVERIG